MDANTVGIISICTNVVLVVIGYLWKETVKSSKELTDAKLDGLNDRVSELSSRLLRHEETDQQSFNKIEKSIGSFSDRMDAQLTRLYDKLYEDRK